MSPARFRILSTLVATCLALLATTGAASAATPGQALAGFTPLAQRFGPEGGSESATGVAIRDDGRIVASVVNDGELDRRIVGLLANGQLDTSFSTDGVWHMPQPGNATVVRALAPLPDGKVVFVGDDSSQQAIVVGRLMKDGELDPTFGGGDGLYVYGTGTGTSPWLEQLIVQGDGRIVFAGSITDATKGRELLIGRLTANGSDDPSFNGVPFTTFGSPADGDDDRFAGLARMPNGEFILGSSHQTGMSGIFRVGPTANYAVVKDLDLDAGADQTVDLVAVDSTHVVALVSSTSWLTALARIDVEATPKLDTSFDGDGIALPFAGSFRGVQLQRQPDGKLVVAGFDSAAGSRRAIARLRANGSLDASFGSGGVQLLAGAATHSTLLRAHEVALTSEGSIVSASHVGAPGATVTAIDRLVGRLARVRTEVLAPASTPQPATSTAVVLRVTNTGPDAAGATSVAFATSGGIVVESSVGPCSYASATHGSCQLPDLAPGTSRDITLQVRRASAGSGTVGVSVTTATYDDDTSDDAASRSIAFVAPPTPAAAPTSTPAVQKAVPRARLRMTVRRVVRPNGRIMRCGFTGRSACITRQVQRRRRTIPMWLRAAARPAPGTARRRVDVRIERLERGRYVKRGSGTVDLRPNGRIDFAVPVDMRRGRAIWRVRISVRGTTTTKPGSSAWFYLRVR